MNFFTKLFFLYFLLINVIGFLSMGLDKRRAKKRLLRIPEKRLFLYGALGGCLGSLLGMYAFRHKTRHLSFQLGMPSLCVLWLAVVILLFVKGILV